MLKRIKEGLNLSEAQWVGFRLGATAGLILFVIYGVPSALVYGGYGGLILAGKIVGTPVEPAILARIVIAVGMIFGLLSSALFFMVLTSLLGIGMGHIGNLLVIRIKAIRAEEVATESAQWSEAMPALLETTGSGGAAVRARRWTKSGAVVAVVLFFIYGLVPGAIYGGATGIILANKLFSMGEPPVYMMKALYMVGSVVGALGTVALFIVLGSVAGTLLGFAYNAGKERFFPSEEIAGAEGNKAIPEGK